MRSNCRSGFRQKSRPHGNSGESHYELQTLIIHTFLRWLDGRLTLRRTSGPPRGKYPAALCKMDAAANAMPIVKSTDGSKPNAVSSQPGLTVVAHANATANVKKPQNYCIIFIDCLSVSLLTVRFVLRKHAVVPVLTAWPVRSPRNRDQTKFLCFFRSSRRLPHATHRRCPRVQNCPTRFCPKERVWRHRDPHPPRLACR